MFKFWLKKEEKKITTLEMKEKFFSHPLHTWMNEMGFAKRSIETFLDSLPSEAMEFIYYHEVLMLKSSGKYALSVQPGSHVIVVFPEVLKLLNSFKFDEGLMMIAHELGHIMYEHGKKSVDTLTAQVEADRFAISLGYAVELEQFLLAQPESIEMRTRLAYLTSQIISKEYKK